MAAIGDDTAGKLAGNVCYTERNVACTICPVERLNITLDDEQAAKLARLADRLHVQPGTVARSLLSSAIDEADPDPRNVVELLDGIPGAHERAHRLGLSQARAGYRSRWTSCSSVARVELALAAVEDLEILIRTHSLPADTGARVGARCAPCSAIRWAQH